MLLRGHRGCGHTLGGEGRREQERGHRRRIGSVTTYTCILVIICIRSIDRGLYEELRRLMTWGRATLWAEKGVGCKSGVVAAALQGRPNTRTYCLISAWNGLTGICTKSCDDS